MKIHHLFWGICLCFSTNILFAQNYQKTSSGIKTTVNAVDIEVQFFAPAVARVIKSPEGVAYEKQSLSVIAKPEKVSFKADIQDNKIVLNTSELSVSVDTGTGIVSYFSKDGKSLLAEKSGMQFIDFDDAGTKTYQVYQPFILDKEEAIYGLGQLQNGKMIQRNMTKNLIQGNVEDVSPFFQSTKGYGVFWDNYSPTLFTDNEVETSFRSEVGDCVDYYFMYGKDADGVIAQVRDLTGQAPMFPLWTYGYWQSKERYKSQEEVVDVVRKYRELGIPLDEQKALSGVAVDAVMDSVSVKTTFKETLAERGVIFCSFSEAVKNHPDLVKRYLGSVVPYADNFFAALNSAVFSDGSFVYIPKGVRCPMELSTYFRINAANTGQFERTLIVADDDSYVSYLEGCTAPMRDENQLHAAIVEIVVHDRAEVKYSTVQNWYPGDAEGKGGVYNFVTKRGNCKGVDSKLSWTQVETGSAITWKYPSCILTGDNSTAEFYSVAVTNNYQQADTGTKMIHLGKNTRSTIVSKGISAGHSENSYRGLVRVAEKADNARNYSQCDSLLLGDKCGAHTFPYMDIHNETAVVEHEATTSKISEDQIFYCNQRGIPTEDAIGLIVNGYAKEVLNKLPMEFAVEAQKLLTISLEGSVG